ncbi:flagellar hook-basal body protein [Priestia flexa]|uniref:flagellar hook-basal body protein n=1 Tax=Priestia flexa TaxID=86664 RepID=UPI002890E15F|nr:flagellar hook-basal body protein [Priestia flexa]MDT2044888.1 flagellar hook-basal body protein [Priestia flexa]
MFKGFYTATAGMLSQQRRTDMLTNNIANANTPGFKEDQGVIRAFPEMLLQRIEEQQKGKTVTRSQENIGSLNTGVYLQETVPNFVQGDLQQTDYQTDLALLQTNLPDQNGGLFFVVQSSEDNLSYTRNGNFSVDPAGFLTTNNGEYVLNINNETINVGSEEFKVDNQGNVMVNGEVTGQLNIAYADSMETIIKTGNGLYQTENGEPLPSTIENGEASYEIKQGFVERSNVNMSQTMTELLTAYRTFEANQKVMQAYDRSMEKAANEIGKVR